MVHPRLASGLVSEVKKCYNSLQPNPPQARCSLLQGASISGLADRKENSERVSEIGLVKSVRKENLPCLQMLMN